MINSNAIKMSLGLTFAAVVTLNANAVDVVVPESGAVKAISEESVVTYTQSAFSALLSKFDTDSSGTLSSEELTKSDNELLQEAFKNIDTNEDAQISADEFSSFK